MGIPKSRHVPRVVEAFGFDLPPTRCTATGGAEACSSHEARSSLDETMALITAEDAQLVGVTRGFLGEACAPLEFGNLRNPGLKLIWLQAFRRRPLPPTGGKAAAYFAKMAEESDRAGGAALTKSALSAICPSNDLLYTSLRVNAALEPIQHSH